MVPRGRDWSDDQVLDWDGNFRDDGDLMLVCVERDVEVVEFRRVVGSSSNIDEGTQSRFVHQRPARSKSCLSHRPTIPPSHYPLSPIPLLT